MTTLVYETTGRCPRFEPDGPSLEVQARAAAAAGFAAICVDGWTADAERARGQDAAALASAVARSGLRCATVVAMRASEGTTSTASARALLPLVQALRPANVLTVFDVAPTPDVVADMRTAAATMAAAGARLAVEFLPHRPVADLAGARAVCAAIGHRAGVCLDAWHFFRGGEQWDELAATPAAEIAYVQCSDALPLASDDLALETATRRTLPGQGEFDLPRFAAAVRATGYDGDVGLEILSPDYRGEDAEAFARRLHASALELFP